MEEKLEQLTFSSCYRAELGIIVPVQDSENRPSINYRLFPVVYSGFLELLLRDFAGYPDLLRHYR
jgi:hypothetical protein